MAEQWCRINLPDGRVKEVWCDPEYPKTQAFIAKVEKEGISPAYEAFLDRRMAKLKALQAERNFQTPKENKMKHCLVYDIYFIISSDECKNCKHLNECNTYKNHRDYENGELFFTFSENDLPLPFGYFYKDEQNDAISIRPYDFDAPLPEEIAISLQNNEFEGYFSFIHFLWEKAYPGNDLPDEFIIQTNKGEISVPIKSLIFKLEIAKNKGPDNTGKYVVSLNENEAIGTFQIVQAITRGLPMVGCLPTESWIRKVHSIIPLLSGKLLGTV